MSETNAGNRTVFRIGDQVRFKESQDIWNIIGLFSDMVDLRRKGNVCTSYAIFLEPISELDKEVIYEFV